MPGLYRNSKRKRLTVNTSQANDSTVWHSTPIDTTTEGEGGGGGGFINDGTEKETGNESEPETLMSPLKRPALDTEMPTPVPHTFATPSSSKVLRAKTVPIPVPVILNLSLEAVEESPEDMEVVDEGEEGEDLLERRERSIIEEPERPGFHNSQRFGQVVINPPSGHGYFTSILYKNGYILSHPKNHLRLDPSCFRKQMEEWLTKNNDENCRIENETSKFLTALGQFFAVKENLRHSFTATLSDKEYFQPSLLHCLLGIKFLQPHLLKVLLPILAEASYSNTQDEIDIVISMMNQMKWLPLLVDGTGFSNDLMDIVENATTTAQKHMVRLLPEIFLPEFHTLLVPKLMTVFNLGTQVNVAILDCFASLEVPETECLQIRHSIVDKMITAPLTDLPAYFAFLFREGTASQIEEGINEMREKVEIIPQGNDPKNDPAQVEILERIRFYVSVNDIISKLWISKIKDDLSCDLELKTLDLIMLFVFAECNDKAGIRTLGLLLERKKLIVSLMDKMLKNNSPIVFQLFPTLASTLDGILRLKCSKAHVSAAEIIRKLFLTLGPIKAQHLMANLVGIVINGHPACRDAVLNIFMSIAETEPDKLLFFHSYLMGALVYVTKFPPRQMQTLMTVLAILAYVPQTVHGQDNSFTLEFMILLRKQITHCSLQTRCFGVMGTLAAVRQLASHPVVVEDKINELLDLAWSSTEKDEESCSIFFDELSNCIEVLPLNVTIKFRDILRTKFETTWTVDQLTDSQFLRSTQGQAGIELVPTFDANKEIQSDQLVIVLEPKILDMGRLVIPCHLRVIVQLEKKIEGGALEGIDSVLGCPILFPRIAVYYEIEDMEHQFTFNQRTHLGQYLVLAINYFRECLSAFCESDNPELRVKVWLRINNLVQLQKILTKHLSSFPNLPKAYGAEGNMESSSNSTGAGFSGALNEKNPDTTTKTKKAKTTKRPKKGKKRAKKGRTHDDENQNEEYVEEEEEEKSDEDDQETDPQDVNFEDDIQPKKIVPYLRRLDVETFGLLKFPLRLMGEPVQYSEILLNLSSATQQVSTMVEVEKFSLESLSFLLTEIKQQTADPKIKLDVLAIDNLVLSLCTHFDSIAAQYGDSIGDIKTQLQVDSCLRSLLNVLGLYIDAIEQLDESPKRSELVQSLIFTLASRYSSDSQLEEEYETQLSLLYKVSKYLRSFSKYVATKNPATAEDHVKLLKKVHDILPQPDHMKKAIDSIMKVYLSQPWKLQSKIIVYFLKTWFSVTPTSINTIKHLVNAVVDDTESEKEMTQKNGAYKSCNKGNFHTWYNSLFTGLAQYVHKQGRKREDFEYSMDFWKNCMELFKKLVLVSQKTQKQTILLPLLKNSRIFLEAFISGGVCLLPKLCKKDTADATAFFKLLQAATRRIQNICEHSKVMKDNNLIRSVPAVKKVLEILIFRVREAIATASCGAANAFWMGALKHRNLKGDVIKSQQFNGSIVESDSSSEEDGKEYSAERREGEDEYGEGERESEYSEGEDDDEYDEEEDFAAYPGPTAESGYVCAPGSDTEEDD